MHDFFQAVFSGEPPSLVIRPGGAGRSGVLDADAVRLAVLGAVQMGVRMSVTKAVQKAVTQGVRKATQKAAAMHTGRPDAKSNQALPVSPARLGILEGLGLLWHDHWEASHEIAQADEGDPDSDLLHAMLHRREGDFANSGYWSGQAGKHPCYPGIGKRIASLDPMDLRAGGLHVGAWSPTAFLAAVRKHANDKGGAAQASLALRRIQAEEFRGFAAYLLEARDDPEAIRK